MNLIELPVSEFKTALTGLNKIISKATCLPVLKHLRVTRNSAGIVSLQATDLDIAATYQAEGQQPGPVCDVLVPMEPLAKAVKNSANGSRIALVKEAKNQFTLRTYIGNSPVDQKVESLDPKEWPPIPRCELPAVTLNEDIRAAVANALECSGDDSTRPLLQGAWIDPSDPKAHYVMGTNGRHLYSANSFTVGFKEPVLVPNKKFVQWSGFMDDGDWQVSIQPPAKKDESSWLQVESDHWRFISKIGEGQCPNWRGAVPSLDDARTGIRFYPPAMEFLQQLLPTLPGGDDFNRPVTFEVDGQTLKVKARPRNSTEWMSVVVPEVEITGAAMNITLNRDYVERALSFGLVNLALVNSASPVVFHHTGKKMVIMPLRPDEPTATAPANQTSTTAPTAPNAETSSATTPATNPNPQPEQKTTMPKATAETNPASETKPQNAIRAVLEQIDGIKATLGDTIRELAALTGILRQVEKEKKASDKEIEAVREKLRDIQSVRI